MASEVRDVLRLFIDEASFLAGSKRRQMGFDTTTKRALLHDDTTDTLAWAVSDDSLQCLLAGTQTLSGAKTFTSKLTVNDDVDAIGIVRVGDSITDSVNKECNILTIPYTGSTDVAAIRSLNGISTRQLFIGGNTTAGDTVTSINFYTGSSGIGTSRMSISQTAIVLSLQLNLGGSVLTGTHSIGRSSGQGLTFDGSDHANFTDNIYVGGVIGNSAVPGSGLSFNTSAIANFSDAVIGGSSIKSDSDVGGVGYATGAGGTVTQGINRSFGVALAKMCGTITTHTASLAAGASATFVVTNAAVLITDHIIPTIQSGATTDQTNVRVTTVTAGTYSITVENNHASTAEVGAIKINVAVFRSVAA